MDSMKKMTTGGVTVEKRKNDLRFKKTKQTILAAMISLLEEKNFEKITVKDICERAEISRSGFYLHYLDKYDLVESYQKELLDKRVNSFVHLPKNNQEEQLEDSLNFLKHDGKILSLLISKNGSPEIREKIRLILEENARQNIIPHIDLANKSEMTDKYLAVFMSHAIIGCLQTWTDTGQKESPKEIVNFLLQILKIKFV